jgi:hypothetical protein
MLGVTAIGKEQRDDRGEREKRERAVEEASRICLDAEEFHMTRNSQHNHGGVTLKCKVHFGQINFPSAGVDNGPPGQ